MQDMEDVDSKQMIAFHVKAHGWAELPTLPARPRTTMFSAHKNIRKRIERGRHPSEIILTDEWTDGGRDQTVTAICFFSTLADHIARLRRNQPTASSTHIQTASQPNLLSLTQPCPPQGRWPMWTCKTCTNKSSPASVTTPLQSFPPR